MTNEIGISPTSSAGDPFVSPGSHTRAFSPSNNRQVALWYLSPAQTHWSARVTGGLANIYRKLKTEASEVEVANTETEVDEDGNELTVFGTELLAKRYEYVRTLGQGRTSVVIQAKDTFMDNKCVAIKVFGPSHFLVGGEEADTLRHLQRSDLQRSMPILSLINTFRISAQYCLTLECCHPSSLHLRFVLRGPGGLKGLKMVGRSLFRALHFVHSLHIIHADVKPDHLLATPRDELSEDGVRLIDFGNCIRSSGELEFYKEDYDVQTLNYRAPEVMVGKSIADSIDMWSAGCTLAELYLGRVLFDGQTPNQVLKAIVSVLGCVPVDYAEGKYAAEYIDLMGVPNSTLEVEMSLQQRLQCEDMSFIRLLASILTYSTETRLTAAQALQSPFFTST